MTLQPIPSDFPYILYEENFLISALPQWTRSRMCGRVSKQAENGLEIFQPSFTAQKNENVFENVLYMYVCLRKIFNLCHRTPDHILIRQ